MAWGRGSGSSRDGTRHMVTSKDPRTGQIEKTVGTIDENTADGMVVVATDGTRYRIAQERVAEVREVPWI